MAQSSRRQIGAGAARLASRIKSAARRPILSGVSYVGDVALAAAVTAAAVVTAAKGLLYVAPAGPSMQHLLAVPSWALVGVLATTAPLAFRRTWPTGAFAMILVALVVSSSYATAITVGAAIFAAYSAVAYSKYRRTTRLVLLAGAVIISVAYPEATAQVAARYTPVLVLMPTVAVASMMRMWRQRATDSAERLRLAQAEHDAEKRRAVELERARIASELHDVVTHNVSVMVVQAGAARRVLEASPGQSSLAGEAQLAREALLAVEGSGRAAMTELRHLLGLLAPVEPTALPGEAGPARKPGAAGADNGALRPQPGLGQVPALIDRIRAAGLEAGLSVTGTRRDLPQGLDLAGYRVVQEALTNVIKHAGRAPTAVGIEYRAHDLLIDVANEAPAGPGTGLSSGNGRGLIGLRERIAIYGGSLDAGPRPGGGWRVRATIPLREASAEDVAAAGFRRVSP